MNWLMGLHAVCAEDSFVDVNLRTFTAGMANNAVYGVSNPTNGAVTLLADGRTARFTPAMDCNGLASFQFTSTDTLAGGGMTNTVSVLITPVAAPLLTSIAANDGKLILSVSGGQAFSSFTLLISTNPALPANSWTRVATNQFDAAGSFRITNTPGAGAANFYRVRVP